MALYLNNLGYEEAKDLILFSDVPNIVTLNDDDAGGTYGEISFAIGNDFKTATTATSQWWISFIGETVSNVINPEDAINKNFYVASDAHSTATSLCKALRNCPSIAAKFQIYLTTTANSNVIKLKAREIGKAWNDLSEELLFADGLTSYISYSGTNGTAISSFYNSKIDIDVYVDDEYTTTMEKTFTGDKCSFDITPVVNTISKIGNTVPFKLYMSYTNTSGTTEQIAVIPSGSSDYNYASVGYMVNQGDKYLTNSGVIAQNYSRGASRSGDGISNNTILYVYNESFPMTIYRGNSGGGTYTVRYLDSAFQEITAQTVTWTTGGTSDIMYTLEIPINKQYLSSSVYYIDVDGLLGQRIRYNVIKPLQMTEHCQRIYFRNSYGGISFFDFTGAKSETRDFELQTYNKNNFDYYTSDVNEREMLYDNDTKYTYTLKSHLIEGDARWIFNDMAQSPYLWTEINNQTYAIILDSISVDEVSTGNNIYECNLKYHLSQKPSN